MREIAIRIALGAQSGDILRLVFAEGMVLTAVGTVLGVALASGASRMVAGLLFGVRTADPITLAAIAILFVFVAVFAMFVPARRALRVKPGFALRQE